MKEEALIKSIRSKFEEAIEATKALRELKGNQSVMLWGKQWSTYDLEKLLELFSRVVER